MRFLRFERYISCLLAIACLCFSGPLAEASGVSSAMSSVAKAVVTDAACDTKVYEAMRQKAWMEAQREVMTNQKMIWKPDSVLALGCYRAWLDVMGKSFTADNQSNLKGTEDLAVKYLEASFKHGLGGGSLGFATAPKTDDCSNMNQLWMAATCKNVDIADLTSLVSISSPDSRIYPPPKSCKSTGSLWALGITSLLASGATADPMNLFTSIVGTKSDAGGTCNKLVVAGSTVCTNAGCNYDNGACK